MANIADIYQKYLDKNAIEDTARSQIAEFYDVEDFEKLNLNDGVNQRIILVGAKFRSEVTATCLWFINHNIDLKCIRMQPYSHGETLFLNANQIIPPPETKGYMIRTGSKTFEEKSARDTNSQRHILRLNFFAQLLDQIAGKASKIYAHRNPGRDHWLTGSTGISRVGYSFIFLKHTIRIELSCGRPIKAENKAIYDQLFALKDDIEKIFANPLMWMQLDDKKVNRTIFEIKFDSYNEGNWPDAINWMDKHMNAFIKVIQPQLDIMAKKTNSI